MVTADSTVDIDTSAVAAKVTRRLGLQALGPAGEGVDFVVYHVGSRTLGDLALRVPRHRRYIAPYGQVDAGDLVRQEHEIAGRLARHGLPVSAPVDLVTCEDGLLVSLARYVPSDGRPVPGQDIGAFLARLHQVEPWPVRLAYQAPGDFGEFLVSRVHDRHKALSRHAADLPDLPDGAVLRDVMDHEDSTARLLHLDIRRQNLLGTGGRLAAAVDWSNALMGPPLMELARVCEYALLPDNGLNAEAVLEGYTATDGQRLDTWSAAALLHRLDTALMLALVFHSVAPHPARARDLTHRSRHLLERLNAAV
ncbi:phosphotransferase family protein [Streptomyces sp. MA5143a]|uniref:phosphotransferase family protein n=1 Tax=Streptomyces sp. MA5143a TaxID=2083010 RepID=UPI000D1BCFDD|nr:aminoglycoside phosphotransferase family protein [Streptomyces sp. MA5143a]SPF04636.1 Phosphotransferase enzyme family protein [Streptomyces sp. MA5143a]